MSLFTRDEIIEMQRGLWAQITFNRQKNLSDMSDESQPLWDLKEKLSRLLTFWDDSQKFVIYGYTEEQDDSE